jgi:hypothetical protein
MKKTQHLKITLPKPCLQAWGDMKQMDIGRHCDSCQKTVVDLSKYTDKELVDFFKNATHGLCGRFDSRQINRSIPIPATNNNSFFHKALFGTALVAGLATVANGQVTHQSIPPAQIPIPTPPITLGSNQNSQISTPKPSEHYIKGTVLGKGRKPLSDAEISIQGMEDSTFYSDSLGRFTIKLPDSLASIQNVVITVSHWHYEDKDVKVSINEQNTKIRLAWKKKIEYHMTMGCPSF